jgi:hypothetical protein
LFPDEIEDIKDVSFLVSSSRFYFDYDISDNSKLQEYYTRVKQGLRSLLVCGKLSSTSIFTPYKVSQRESLIEICEILPIAHHIL